MMISNQTTNESPQQAAERVGRGYARDSWSNVDNAAASWLRSGSSSAITIPNAIGSRAAESAFVRGFMAERARR